MEEVCREKRIHTQCHKVKKERKSAEERPSGVKTRQAERQTRQCGIEGQIAGTETLGVRHFVVKSSGMKLPGCESRLQHFLYVLGQDV